MATLQFCVDCLTKMEIRPFQGNRRRDDWANHCAVLVAEDIASRFLNVDYLFNGTVLFVAIQMLACNVVEDDEFTTPRRRSMCRTILARQFASARRPWRRMRPTLSRLDRRCVRYLETVTELPALAAIGSTRTFCEGVSSLNAPAWPDSFPAGAFSF